jgi:hypothetical protein
MTVKHLAFTFDFMQAHQKLYDSIVEGNVVDHKKLQIIAQEIVPQADEELLTILSNFRYGKRALQELDQGYSADWYIIYIATFFQTAPSLSNNRKGFSHFVLEAILPLLGWEKVDVKSLIHGKPVEDLMKKTNFSLLAENLDLESFCLGKDDITDLKAKLIVTRDQFVRDEKITYVLSKLIFGGLSNDLDELAENAFNDGIDMLSAIEKHGDTLFLFRD